MSPRYTFYKVRTKPKEYLELESLSITVKK